MFAECTVLTIAHRLHTIIDSDQILVMDKGQAVEFDDAHTLLQATSGIFKGMVESLGPQEYERLAHVAFQNHKRINSCSFDETTEYRTKL